MPLKAFKLGRQRRTCRHRVSAIYYAVDNGATVVNMSFTLTAPSQALLDAIAYAMSKRVLLVAAVGNNGSQMATYPAFLQGRDCGRVHQHDGLSEHLLQLWRPST